MQLTGGGGGSRWDNNCDRSKYPRCRMVGARLCPAATAPRCRYGVGATPAGIFVDRHRQRWESVRKRPTREGEEDAATMTTECDENW